MRQNREKPTKVKFATQAESEVLEALRSIAAGEGRQIQALVDEALRAYIERRRSDVLRKHVLQALQASIIQHDSLYKELGQ